MSRPRKDMEAQYSAYMRVLDKISALREQRAKLDDQIQARVAAVEDEVRPLRDEMGKITRRIERLFAKAGSPE